MSEWEESIKEGKVIKITPNLERSSSLKQSSLKLLNIINKINLDNENGFFFITNYYDIILEVMHSLMFKKGYNVLDHLSIGYYIKDILKNQEIFELFNKYRKIRNNIIYYGKSIDTETSKQAIKDLQELYEFVKELK
tara:strand:+ start:2785 stop:3195 length:411 start_codon:yes stop_codon:yes gene_type:complete